MRSSLSCSVLRVNKLLPAFMALPTAAALAGCSVMDVVGPRPNSELVSLANQAEADALAGDADLRELRASQADQLRGETLRLCGTEPDGEVPRTCAFELDAAGLTAEPLAQLVSSTVATAPHLPEESIDLVVAQAVDATAIRPVELAPEGLVLVDADFEPAKAALEREYALAYGLGLAEAFADGALRERIHALQATSQERVALLERGLGTEAPVAASGYQLAGGQPPATVAEAAELVERLQREVVEGLRFTAARAHSQNHGDAWRRAAILLAAQAQRA